MLSGGLILLLLSPGFSVPVWAEPRQITLKKTVINDFSSLSPPKPKSVKPAFKEKAFPLKDAENLKEVKEFIGGLSPEEKAFLEKNRFLLKPKPDFLPPLSGGDAPADEMLAWFDALGGGALRSERKGDNARLVSPDVFLHAWHLYMSNRLAAVERGPLLAAAREMLAGLYHNSAELRGESGAGADNWERLMAQLVVPLILLDGAGDGAAGAEGPGPQKALDRFEAYRDDFSKARAKNIRAELVKIYRAEAREANLLGLGPVDGSEVVNYALFKPRGRYAADAAAGAYFRAVTWLSNLGWDAGGEAGLADALNCALALSYDRATPKEASGGKSGGHPADSPSAGAAGNPRRAWTRFMEISAFFFGYPESPSYQEWLPFLMKEAGVSEFTAATGSDAEVLRRLAASSETMGAPVRPYFKSWPSCFPKEARVQCLLPKRRTPSDLIAAELRRGEGANDGPPLVTSALWLPVMMGHREARELLPRQAALPRNLPSGQAENPADDPFKRSLDNLVGRLENLAALVFSEPEPAWFGTADASYLKLLSTLAASYDAGYPLYMRSPAFPFKRLETIVGGYAGLKHEPPAPTPSGPAPAAEPSASLLEARAPAPLVKGLVEPDTEFWQEMIRVAEYVRSGFQKHDLFPEDLEDYGSLTRFLKRLERCAALAEKELAGQDLSEDDYEFIRLFSLGWMAVPPGGSGGEPGSARIRSGGVTALQVLPPEVEGGLVVYEATAEPWLMLVLAGNEKSPRLVLGLAYSHYEFVGPFEPRLTDALWLSAAYARYHPGADRPGPGLPPRNFWYEALKP